MTHLTTPDEQALREKLAAIEHERWSDWQAWCHKVLREQLNPEGLDNALEGVLARWDRQISTNYADLTDDEKASDMQQVDRYWPLIEAYTAQAVTTALQQVADGLPDKPVKDWLGDDGFCNTCEAFLEDDKYQCYCDIRGEAIDQAHQAIATVKKQWEKTND